MCKLNIACVPRKRITVSSDRTFPVPIWRGRFPIFFPLCICIVISYLVRLRSADNRLERERTYSATTTLQND